MGTLRTRSDSGHWTKWMLMAMMMAAAMLAPGGLAGAAPLLPAGGLGGGGNGDGDGGPMQSGSVTLPWADAKSLLKDLLAPDDETKPPAPYVLESAAWTGELKDKHIELTAECVFSVLTATGWVKAPVASSKAVIKSVTLDGQPVGLHDENGLLHIVTNEPGRHKLTLTLVAAVSGSGQAGGSARFALAPFPQNSLTIKLPSADYEFTIPQCAFVDVEKGADGATAVVRAAFGQTEALDLRWERKVTVAEGAMVATKISSRAFSQFSIGEGLAAITDRVNYTILYNTVSAFKVEVPVKATVTSVEGPGVKGWKVEMPADKKAEKAILEVAFANETKGEGYFVINREMPLRDGDLELALPMIQPLGVERNTGWVGVSAAANVECKVMNSQKLTQTDVEEAPRELGSLSPDPLVLAFKYTDGPIALTLTLRRFDTLPVLTAIVDHADYTVLLTEEGKVLTRGVFQTRNNRNQYLQVALPEGATIWSSFVAGEPVKPAMDDNGNLLLVLKKSFTVGEQTLAFPVEVVYLQELEDFESRGRLALTLARPDVPVSRAFVTLLAPEDFKLRGFKGTLKKLDEPEPEYLEPVRYEMAEASVGDEVVPSRRAGVAKAAAPASPPAALDSFGTPNVLYSQSTPAEGTDLYFNYGIGSQMKTSRGLLPIPIDIPSVGKPHYFGKILTTDEAFELSFTYRTKWLF